MYNWIMIDAVKEWLSVRPYGRMVLAVATGIVFTWLVLAFLPQSDHPAVLIVTILCWFFLPTIISVVTYHNLLRRFGTRPRDGETHCRKCDYILRGLSEPRCPECGEQI